MRRRAFLTTLAAAAGSSTVGIEFAGRGRAATGRIPDIEAYSASSLLDHNDGQLTDDSYVPVWVEDTASNRDDDGNGDATLYGEDTRFLWWRSTGTSSASARCW